MIDHLSSYATDFSASRSFYTTVLSRLGFEVQMEFAADSDEEFPGRRMCAWGPAGRPIYGPDYYRGFLLDPDGNNVEAVCHAAVG